jgi:2-desacetyl-2-hydroxyethyl bacteriochlorophyllide A dehydrogenase
MRETARTAVITGPRAVQVRDLPLPPVGPREVLVANVVSGISAGTEMNVYRGLAPQWRTRRDPATGLFEPTDVPEWTYPLAYGYAAVGRVQHVGYDLDPALLGDLVFSYTSHSSHAVVPVSELVVLPTLAHPRVGVLTANVNTALNGMLDARPVFGDAVVVSGLGVIGLIVTQLLRRSGASLVIGVDSVEERRQLAKQFGADLVLSPHERVAERTRQMTDNRGADIVIEVSGAAPALHEAIRTAGYDATVIAMSWYGGSFESLSLSGEFHHNRTRIISSQVAGINPTLGPLWSVKRRKTLATALLADLDLEPLLTHTFPIDHAADAYALVNAQPPDLVQCLLSYEDLAR